MALRLFLHWERTRTEGSDNPSSERRASKLALPSRERLKTSEAQSILPPLLKKEKRLVSPFFVAGGGRTYLPIIFTYPPLCPLPLPKGGDFQPLHKEDDYFKVFQEWVREIRLNGQKEPYKREEKRKRRHDASLTLPCVNNTYFFNTMNLSTLHHISEEERSYTEFEA